MINDTFEALVAKKVKAEAVGTDDDRAPALPRLRQQGFDTQINPANVTEAGPAHVWHACANANCRDYRKARPAPTSDPTPCRRCGQTMACRDRGAPKPKPEPPVAEARWRCPKCGGSKFGLMAPDFETAKCARCGKNSPAIDPPMPSDVAEATTARSTRDPGNARGFKLPKLPSMKAPFSRGASGLTQFQLRPRIQHGKFAVHGPGDVAPAFRFHNENIAKIVAKLLQRHTKKPHAVIQNDLSPPLR